MNKKKIKRINVRVNLKDYLILKGNYLSNKKKFKTFSSYLRHLLDLGLNNDHQKVEKNENCKNYQ